MGSVLIVAPMAVLGLAAWAISQRIQPPTPVDVVKRTSPANLTHLTRNLVEVCRTYHLESLAKLKSGQAILEAAGRIYVDGNHSALWHTRNEITGQEGELQLPVMMAGNAKFLPVSDFTQTAPIVDEIAKIDGTPATIFQRMNGSGDMLRICSSIKSATGTRAIGDYVPADARDTDSAKALQEVLLGHGYTGKQFQGATSYLTAYQPLTNKAGAVVGMLLTTLPEDQIRSKVRPLLEAGTNVDHVELFILQASGQKRGTALVLADSALEGSDLWNEQDAAGHPFIKDICLKAMKLASGEFADYRYQRATRVGGLPRTVRARFAFVPELDWVVGFTQPETDLLAGIPPSQAFAPWGIWMLLGIGIAGTGLAVRIWIKFSEDLARKLNAVLDHLRKDAKQLNEAAAELSQEANRALAVKSAGKADSVLSPGSTEIVAKAAHMIEEIRLALQHIDASSLSVVGMIAAIDQITFATNLLTVNAAIQASNWPNGNEPISGVADELRYLAEQCRKAARYTKAEIDQSRAEMEKGNREVLQLVKDLRSEAQSVATAPVDETALALRRQANTLLKLAEALDHKVAVISADFGVN